MANLAEGSRIACCALALLAAASAHAQDSKKSPLPGCKLADAAVERVIASKARQIGGQEYCQFRHYNTLDDVDGDGVDDFIVLFTVEGRGGGGNDHTSFMAVWLSGRPNSPLVVETGGRGLRDPVAIEVRDRKIRLETLEYLPKDPMCCPSGKGELPYEIKGGKLEAVKKPGR